MSAVGWLVLGGVVWFVVSVAVAVVIGRASVRRDRQKPRPPQRRAAPDPHAAMDAAMSAVLRRRGAGPRKGEQR